MDATVFPDYKESTDITSQESKSQGLLNFFVNDGLEHRRRTINKKEENVETDNTNENKTMKRKSTSDFDSEF